MRMGQDTYDITYYCHMPPILSLLLSLSGWGNAAPALTGKEVGPAEDSGIFIIPQFLHF